MFGKKQDEKQPVDSVAEKAREISMIRYLDSHVINTGLAIEILYSFVMTYKDGHCEILEAKAKDPLLQLLLPKLI